PGEEAPLPTPSPFVMPGFGASPAAEKYRKIEKVGVGAYGSVFKAENTETKEIVAIKAASRKEDPVWGGFPLSLLREISILRSVRHENIVQMHEIAHTTGGDPLIVMEFCQASLLELIHSPKHDLSFSEIKYIIRQDRHYGPGLDIWSVGCILAEILLCQTGRRQPFFGGDPENPNKTVLAYVEEIFYIMGKPTDETWPGLCKLPNYRTYVSGKISSAKAHKEQGDERGFLRRFFRNGIGKPADSKYCLTESFFEMLGGLLSLCPKHRVTAAEALQHPFFTKEKPVPEWHAWHWALASADIPRGDEARKKNNDEDEARKLLKQLSKEDVGTEEAGDKTNGGKAKAVLEKWREQAEKRQQQEIKRTNSMKSAKAPEELPAGWTKHWSSSKQRFYYHDGKT
ncbi:cdk11, partial [Symbiodinium microadriaticum]